MRRITGSKTKLDYANGVAPDATGKIYALTGYDPQAVLVVAAGASGNVKPLQKIHGPDTGLDLPLALAVR